MQEHQVAGVSAVAALDEPTRRRLYDHVVRQTHAVSRDEAAAAVDLPRTTAAFHLDRLVDEGLLDVVHERRTGRRGPGAGRPAKLYRRSACDVSVSLPERRYDLAGQLLAASIEEASRSGGSAGAVLERRAYELGRELAASEPAEGEDHRAVALRILESHGYEPRAAGDDVALGNCPFHVLARDHTTLVCGMNLRLLSGLLDGLAPTGLAAHLRPGAATCCVRLEPGPAAVA